MAQVAPISYWIRLVSGGLSAIPLGEAGRKYSEIL
jgi:hypothetical protein